MKLKKKLKNRRLHTGIALGACSLVLAAGGTYAWLSSNFYTEANNEQIQLSYGGVVIVDYNVYKYDQGTDTVINLTEVDDPGRIVDPLSELGGYEITPYDSIFTERNAKTPLVFEMKLITESIDNLYLSCACSSGAPQGLSTETRYTSNIMRIGAATANCLGLSDSSDDNTKFNCAIEYFKEYLDEAKTIKNDKTQTFQQVNGSGSSKSFGVKYQDITCEVRTADSEVLPQSKEATVYFVMDYSMDLVELHHIDKFSLIEITQEYVPFYDDITFTGFTLIQQ